jgi:hypothetical protein
MTIVCSFERRQYHEIRKSWEKAGDSGKNKGVCDSYGAEHLARLIGMLNPHAMEVSFMPD